MAELTPEQEMIKSFWIHPTQDADGDNVITAKEKVFYILKMIPWTVMQIFAPLLLSNVKKGVADLLPLAASIAGQIALNAVTGDQKAIDFNEQMRIAGLNEGRELAVSDINWLRENAVQIIKNEAQNPQ